jgi:hypothetical protein
VTTGGNINHEESFSVAKISARGIAVKQMAKITKVSEWQNFAQLPAHHGPWCAGS